ncbi:MAG TPA: hypothetical protein VLC46_09015 [Thermoanaerobaculia bacterium]|jgi:hypothetical protein|nr:hypothetical protein [Thermoanaerobaculia bacterium]
MRFDADRLIRMLPAVYGLRDASQQQLRALLNVISGQIGVMEENLAQLYDDQFVDTCDDWVLPYIGDLLGNSPLYAGNPADGDTARSLFPELTGPRFASRVALRARPDVARTIYYRKRKATLPMLEELAHDVTGWAAHVVEFFELLGWTQCIRNHVRPQCHLVDVRQLDELERLDGPFDVIPHTIDVAPINQHDGWYEIRNVGFFLWRLGAYGMGDPDAANVPDADARIVGAPGDFRFHVNPAGIDAPLFSRYRPTELSGVTESRVSGPIRPLLLALDILDYKAIVPADRSGFSELYGDAGTAQSLRRSFAIFSDGTMVPPEKICSGNLSTWKQPPLDIVAVDTRSGRISFGPSWTPKNVRVSYHYGFAADLGGGPYPRASWLIKRHLAEDVLHVAQSGAAGTFSTVFDAVAQWKAGGRKSTVIVIDDNHTYDETKAITLNLLTKKFLAIEAAEGKRPHVLLEKGLTIQGDVDAMATLSGLLVEGTVKIKNAVGRVRVLHSTLIPDARGAASITANDPPGPVTEDPLRIEIAFSITGPILATGAAQQVTILDSIVDAAGNLALGGLKKNDYGPPASIERTTIFGTTRVRELPLATEVIFDQPLFVERRQSGCVRFSYVPHDQSRTPRRYRCQPDLEIARALDEKKQQLGRDLLDPEQAAIVAFVTSWLVPSYTSARYGDSPYAQLHINAPRQIARGAEDGSEMGAFCHLKQPQREDNLVTRLAEYLPFGLQPGIIYVT